MFLRDLDIHKLAYPKLRKLIKNQIDAGVETFQDLKPTIPHADEIGEYGRVEDNYIFEYPVQQVFDHYQKANPEDSYNHGGLIAFGVALDKNSGEVYYPGDKYPGAKEGQVFYFHCTILGIKTLCMAQEIIQVDDAGKKIVFSYVEGGMTHGTQEIKFTALGAEKTKVTHVSVFKGISKFRDNFYPFFHSMIVGKFHANLKKSLNSK